MKPKVKEILKLDQPGDIINVVRLGSRKDKDGNVKDYARPLLIALRTPELAEYYHDYGMGYKTEDGYWFNPDLPKLQREANFRAKQQRREYKKQERARIGLCVEPKRVNCCDVSTKFSWDCGGDNLKLLYRVYKKNATT